MATYQMRLDFCQVADLTIWRIRFGLGKWTFCPLTTSGSMKNIIVMFFKIGNKKATYDFS